MAETLSTLSILSFAVAGGCLVLAIFFWFFFQIPLVIGDLSGTTARKTIARMRAANEKAGVKRDAEGKINAARGNLITLGPNLEKRNSKKAVIHSNKSETGLLAENKAESIDSEETDRLDSEATGLLMNGEATAALDTALLAVTKRAGGKKLKQMEEIILIHTNEVIQ